MTKLKENQAIAHLDLVPIKTLLNKSDSGPKWDCDFIDSVEPLYKSFLFLIWKYPDEHIVPTPEVDIFWHTHILDTKKYMEDCSEIFGKYIHHNPHKGLGGKQDVFDLNAKFKRTLDLIKIEFPELY